MRLKSNYEAQLIEHFQEIVAVGATVIPTTKLRIWVDQERVTVTIWRTVAEYWTEFVANTRTIPAKQKDMPLFVGDASKEAGAYTFVWGEGLVETEKTWLKALSSWC